MKCIDTNKSAPQILEIPIRNWNGTETIVYSGFDIILEIPIRNWNIKTAMMKKDIRTY